MRSRMYTFLMDFKGGTYISQVSAINPQSGVFAWAQQLDTAAIQGLSDSGKDEILQGVKGETPTAIKDLQRVWCVFLTVDDSPCLVNFIEMDI